MVNKMNSIDMVRAQLPSGRLTKAYFAMSIHKSGSTLMNNMIESVCSLAGLPSLSIPDVLFKQGVMDEDWSTDESIAPIFGENLIFYGFRYFPLIIEDRLDYFKSCKSVILVRDPRDTLVSEFFSYGGASVTHVAPDAENPNGFKSRFVNQAGMGIDDYVRWSAYDLYVKLAGYRGALSSGNVKLFRYEDIIFEKQKFISDIFSHYTLDVDPAVLKSVAEDFDFVPANEDSSKHIRKAIPGDYREKLRPETIGWLNDFFSGIGAEFGYKL